MVWFQCARGFTLPKVVSLAAASVVAACSSHILAVFSLVASLVVSVGILGSIC